MLIGSLSVAITSSAYAHHSDFYDECKRVTIEGHVERVQFKNPHNLIVLRLDDGAAYSVDWLSVTRLGSAGILDAAKAAVVPGARISVTGYLIRDAAELRRVAPKFKGEVDPKTRRSPIDAACGRQLQLGDAQVNSSELRPAVARARRFDHQGL